MKLLLLTALAASMAFSAEPPKNITDQHANAYLMADAEVRAITDALREAEQRRAAAFGAMAADCPKGKLPGKDETAHRLTCLDAPKPAPAVRK